MWKVPAAKANPVILHACCYRASPKELALDLKERKPGNSRLRLPRKMRLTRDILSAHSHSLSAKAGRPVREMWS